MGLAPGRQTLLQKKATTRRVRRESFCRESPFLVQGDRAGAAEHGLRAACASSRKRTTGAPVTVPRCNPPDGRTQRIRRFLRGKRKTRWYRELFCPPLEYSEGGLFSCRLAGLPQKTQRGVRQCIFGLPQKSTAGGSAAETWCSRISGPLPQKARPAPRQTPERRFFKGSEPF